MTICREQRTGKIDYSQDFFGKKTNLTVSGQLEAEIFALAFRNVYTFGPTFRAENSNTARHASEFWMIEPEMAFADLNDYLEVAEDMIKYIINFVLEKAPEEMQFFNSFVDKTLLARLDNIVNSDFGRVTYTEAVELLQKSGKEFQYPVEWGIDLQTEHERYLTEEIFKKPVFVTDYPKDIKAFYMRLNDDGKTVAAADLLVPGVGEIIGGSQREERLEVLEKRMEEMGLNKGRLLVVLQSPQVRRRKALQATVWALNESSCTSPACRTSETYCRSREHRRRQSFKRDS